MEDDNLAASHSTSAPSFIMVALGLAGLVAGAAALFLHFSQQKDPLPQVLKLQEQIALLQEQSLQLQNQLHVLEDQVTKNTLQLQSAGHGGPAQAVRSPRALGQAKSAPGAEHGPELGLLPTGPCHSYTIQSGDTFSKIAERQKVSLQGLLGANPGIDPKRLRVGQVIQVPGLASQADN